jgi:hypothetical protein
MQLSKNFKSCLGDFVYYYTNGNLPMITGETALIKYDYREILKSEPSIVESVFRIYSNNVKMDIEGNVLNHFHAMKRAAQLILYTIDADYNIDPDLEDWELNEY